jgi:AcrR family transcriptional regulator
VETAGRHFSELGFRGASAGAIAQDAGFSEPGLLHHFGSKRGLLLAVLEQRYSFDEQKLLSDEELEGLTLLPLLARLVRENLRQRESVTLTMVMLAESISAAHPSHSFFKNRYERAREIVAGHLQRAKKQGYLRNNVDTAALAAVLLAAMDGLQLQWLIDKNIDMAACFDVLVELLQVAIAKPK